jgi:glyoxylase-like metal-dependent hydrolase (beta-lactamase superfamily II)
LASSSAFRSKAPKSPRTGGAVHSREQNASSPDFGFSPDALVNNVNLVGIDPAALDALVLSHGHYDHFGGLAGFLSKTAAS